MRESPITAGAFFHQAAAVVEVMLVVVEQLKTAVHWQSSSWVPSKRWQLLS